MSLEPHECVYVKCDRCGKLHGEDDDFGPWHYDPAKVDRIDEVVGDDVYGGWLIVDGKHYCEGCWRWDEEGNDREPIPADVKVGSTP